MNYAEESLRLHGEWKGKIILPAAFDPRVGPAVAGAVAQAAHDSGTARI